MRLAKIKNNYLFNSNNPNGIHTYAVYYYKKTKSNRAIGLTHLYVKDKNRFNQVRRGNILVEKFKEFDVPSGVKNSYFDKNIVGKKIDFKDRKNVLFVSNRYLSKKQACKIINFAKRREK